MRNLKKFLALVLAFMMVMSLMITANAAPATPTDFDDGDKITSTYAEAVNVLSALGVVKGDNGFRPGDPISRAETAAMLYRIAHNDAAEAQVKIYKDYDQFPDVLPTDWFAGAVNYCANSELIKGWDGKFHPDSNVTGYEVLAMTLRMLGYGQNGEFEGANWQIQTARYGRLAGLTKNIKEGTLGAPATREVVAEIMFQALQADIVDYNMLYNYFPSTVLIADNATNAANYKNAIDKGLLTLPLNADLMYVNYGIVGKSPTLTFDKFGRPSEMWVKDGDSTVENTTDAGKYSMYIPNFKAAAATDDIGTAIEPAAQQAINVVLTPVATYDNAVTECQVSKDISDDDTRDWNTIAEVLNGNAEATLNALTTLGATQTMDYNGGGVNHKDGTSFDALHTSDKWIGANGRTTEIYDISDYGVTDGTNDQDFLIVYVDTFLAEVKSITEAVKDPNDHEIKPAAATVKVGADELEVTMSSAKSYKVGDLVLVQTANYGETNNPIKDITAITTGEKVPVTPADVHIVNADLFPSAGTNCKVVDKAETKRVTIKGTKGVQDDKTGITTTDGDVIWASNTFLANKTAANKTVLPDWYDVDDATKGITNSMIGRTFDLVLDHHGYIVGMKEVLTIDSSVGVITGYDQVRVGTGKYLTGVEAYMADGSTQTFNVVDMDTEFANVGTATPIDTKNFKLFKTGAAADGAWDPTASGSLYGGTTAKLGIGSLVMFKQCTVDGVSAWYFADRSDPAATVKLQDKAGATVTDNNMVGTLTTANSFKTGDALAIDTVLALGTPGATLIDHQLDNKSVIFVAEPEYAYNTGDANEGNNSLKYNVYEGFKKAPTISGLNLGADGNPGGGDDTTNILYQQLVNNPEYVLVYPQRANQEYIIKNQATIAVDDSYLVLSRGTTYANYSDYNVLKNGVADVLQVSNSNDTLNATIEAAMAAGDLLTVTGRNAAGYVIAAETVANLAQLTPTPNEVAVKNCGGVEDATGLNPLVAGANTVLFSETDGVINFVSAGGTPTYHGLTLADNCTIQLVNLGTGAVKDISLGVAKVYINKDGGIQDYCDFTFELDQYGYVCSLYVIEQ